ncbi:MAG TPA: acetyl-CoA carboxylase biotin carboxyl carrier protein [Phycisphaerae bacterium]|nr:acetyl-CoA carboxylase biotin carboxyl carrier protein [Phycisphaerae bacterium]HPS53105.1 acetyl-CoA carboxylase biotin carboxyl carrier protein [Phycisphaerae bacterium]
MSKKAVKKTASKTAAGKAAKTAVTAACDKEKVRKNVVSGKPASPLLCDVEHLMHIMAANDVTEIDIVDGSRKISLKRGTCAAAQAVAAPAATIAAAAAAPAIVPAAGKAATSAAGTDEDENLQKITSPMVGTFYSSPSPDSESFAKVGDAVNDDTVVCIIEAMKVMNEIKAEIKGTIVEVCVKNAQPVEFGQVLFKVKP